MKTLDSIQWPDDTGLANPTSSTSSADVSPVMKAMIGVTVVGSVASTALAENRMKQRLPRGFSIKKSTDTAQTDTTGANTSQLLAAAPIAAKEAARFLAQSTMGTRKADIAKVQALGSYANWITDQFTLPYPTLAVTWLFSKKFNVEKYRFDSGPFYQTIWRLMINSNTQLRQRIVFALSNIFVINANSLNMGGLLLQQGISTTFCSKMPLEIFGHFLKK